MLFSNTRTGWNLQQSAAHKKQDQHSAEHYIMQLLHNEVRRHTLCMSAQHRKPAQLTIRCLQVQAVSAGPDTSWLSVEPAVLALSCQQYCVALHLKCAHLFAGSVSMEDTSTTCFTPPDCLAALIMLTTPCKQRAHTSTFKTHH